MGSEAEEEPSSSRIPPKLPAFSIPLMKQMQSPQHSGMLTPPLQTSASVPFRWEEEPGKPRPCTDLITLPTTTTTTQNGVKCLELPPRLVTESIITKMPSPTTVLEGPYNMGSSTTTSKSLFECSSFRIMKDFHGSFGSERRQFGSERRQFGPMVLTKKRGHMKAKKGFFGRSWGWGRKKSFNKRQIGKEEEGSFVFSPFLDSEDVDGGYSSECGTGTRVKITKIRRHGSFLGLSHPKSNFLATVYEGLKHAIPWGSRKKKKDGFSV